MYRSKGRDVLQGGLDVFVSQGYQYSVQIYELRLSPCRKVNPKLLFFEFNVVSVVTHDAMTHLNE